MVHLVGFKSGRAIIQNSQLRQLRDLKILERKITSGLSNKELAKEFGIYHKTVKNALSRIARSELAQKFEDQLLTELGPLAMNALKGALQAGNEQVALEVLKGIGVLKKPGTPINQGDGDELELHIRAKRSRPPASQPPADPQAADREHLAEAPGFTAEEISTAISQAVEVSRVADQDPGEPGEWIEGELGEVEGDD